MKMVIRLDVTDVHRRVTNTKKKRHKHSQQLQSLDLYMSNEHFFQMMVVESDVNPTLRLASDKSLVLIVVCFL